MKKVRVLCSLIVEVEMDDDDYERRHFIIEENSCPGTQLVGRAIQDAIDKGEEDGTCWACALSGQNRIIMDDGQCRYVPIPGL